MNMIAMAEMSILPLCAFKIKCKRCLRKYWPESSLFSTPIISSLVAGSSWKMCQCPPFLEKYSPRRATRQGPHGYCLLWLPSYHLTRRDLVKGSFLGICSLTLICNKWVENLFLFSVGNNYNGEAEAGKMETKILEIRWHTYPILGLSNLKRCFNFKKVNGCNIMYFFISWSTVPNNEVKLSEGFLIWYLFYNFFSNQIFW